MFEINLSRNRFIEYIHEKSYLPYSKLRELCKKLRWNMSDIYIELFAIDANR